MMKTDNGQGPNVDCESITKRIFQLPSRGLKKLQITCL